MERALRGGFPGVPPERRGARAAAAITRLVRSEVVGGTARTPCAFAERGAALTEPSRPVGMINGAWGHYSPSEQESGVLKFGARGKGRNIASANFSLAITIVSLR